MIDGKTIEQAERLLRIVVGDGMDVQGQFNHYKVDRQAYENFHQEMMGILIKRLQQSRVQVPNTAMPIINTIMAHHFLVGVVASRLAAESDPSSQVIKPPAMRVPTKKP